MNYKFRRIKTMLRVLAPGLLISSLLISGSSGDNGYARCNCDDEFTLWTIDNIIEIQRVSDILIAVAYFSIPLELLYFISCSNLPFKWVLFQFIAFIVLCGMTHLLNGWTYVQHTFQLMLALTVFKILTALVSCATAITLVTLIPLLLKVKVRELMLKKKTWDLGREVETIMKKKVAGLHESMLTHEIRKSLDRHTILYTTLVELSKTLGLQNCVVWMPNDSKSYVYLTHELNRRNFSNPSLEISDPDIQRIKASEGVGILERDSPLAELSSGESGEAGHVAAIRVPVLRCANFKGGTPELVQTCYGILVLVLPSQQQQAWNDHDIKLITAVADQVAVALSHAAILEESQLLREKLEEQNEALQKARLNAMMASHARNSFQKVMSDGMRRPLHSVLGLLSMMQDDSNLNGDQRLIVDSMLKTGDVISALINDVMEISTENSGRFPLEMRSFSLHEMIREIACIAKCLCIHRNFSFLTEIDKGLPDHVMSDERKIFQVIFHMVGNLLKSNNGTGSVILQVFSVGGSHEWGDHRRAGWRQSSSDGNVCVRFDIGIRYTGSILTGSTSNENLGSTSTKYDDNGLDKELSRICTKLVQLMQGNLWVVPSSKGNVQTMSLVLRFQLRPSIAIGVSESGESSDNPYSNSFFDGLQVLLADADEINRAVTRRQLEKLGCTVSTVSSGFACLNSVGSRTGLFKIVIVDLHMPDLDGFEVAMTIRRSQSCNWPMILGLTANADDEIWERCMQTGINGVIRKPVQLQGIASELRRVVTLANKVILSN